MQCDFEEFEPAREDGWRRMRCTRCGLITAPTPHPPEMIHAVCQKRGLGDYIAIGLAYVGITSALVSSIIGRPCNCPQGQEWFNSLTQGKKE